MSGEIKPVIIDNLPPPVPALISPANGAILNNNLITLSWEASPSPDLAGYLLDFDGDINDVGNTTSITGVLDAGTYTWTVAAYDAVYNISAFAGVRSFTVEPITDGDVYVFLPLVLNNYDPSELLQNGDFDTGIWTPWTTMTLPALTDQVYHSASYSARLGGYNNAGDFVSQEVTVPSNATEITLDFWYRVSGDDPDPEEVLCIEILGNEFAEPVLAGGCLPLYELAQNQWLNDVQLVLNGTDLAPLLGQTVFVTFDVFTNATNPGTAWVDDVSFRVTGAGR